MTFNVSEFILAHTQPTCENIPELDLLSDKLLELFDSVVTLKMCVCVSPTYQH